MDICIYVYMNNMSLTIGMALIIGSLSIIGIQTTLTQQVYATAEEYENTEANREYCYDEGLDHGKDHPFSMEAYEACGGNLGAGNNAYYNGFIAGCLTVEGNTAPECENAADSS